MSRGRHRLSGGDLEVRHIVRRYRGHHPGALDALPAARAARAAAPRPPVEHTVELPRIVLTTARPAGAR